MKIFKKILLALAVLVVAIIVIFNQNISAFVYNELEWRARAHYLLAEEVQNQVEYLIGIRTGKESAFISDQEKINKIPEDINEALDFVKKLIDTHQVYVNRQDKIPFLPANYKQYQALKKPAFENYQKSLELFIDLKKKEHQGARLVQQLDTANAKFAGLGEEKSWEDHFQEMTDAYEVAPNIISEAQALYRDKVIDEGMRDYIILYSNKIIDFYEIITNPKNVEYDPAVAAKLEAIGERGSEIDFNEVVTNWHKNLLDGLENEMLKYKDMAYEQIAEADKYYRENDLKSDLISRLLSRFSKSYPKNI